MKKTVLIVGQVESPHLQSWVQASSSGAMKVKIFPVDRPSKANFKDLSKSDPNNCIKISFLFKVLSVSQYSYRILDKISNKKWRSALLKLHIKSKKTLCINFHELQSSGYLLLNIENYVQLVSNKTVVCSSWGSDLALFGKIQSHERDLKSLLAITDVLTAERDEEELIARSLGFKGTFHGKVYTSVGTLSTPMNSSICSSRKKILIKGYQNIPGRALNALKAIEICKDELKGWDIAFFAASESVVVSAELIAKSAGLSIRIVPKQSKETFLEEYKEARIYIGVAISDGLSTSMAEAMATGAFPIQSENSAASDFIEDGVNGYIVDPWDISKLATLIKAAATDDDLVDKAQARNLEIIKENYDYNQGRLKIVNIYKRAIKSN
jgi:glycosyltransferase involved in cell wall biosynthesis